MDNYKDNGKTVKMAVHSRFKEALKQGQKWYKDKILDSELPTVNNTQRNDKIANGLAGAFTCPLVYISYGTNPNSANYLPQLIYSRDAAAKVVMTPVPYGSDGRQIGQAATGAMPLDANNFFTVKKGVSDEKLVKILQLAEYINWDPKGRIQAYFGWPDKHFTWAGEPWNSYIQMNEGVKMGDSTGLGYYTYENWYGQLHDTFYVTPMQQPIQVYYSSGDGAKAAVPQYREDVFGETNYAETWSQFRGPLDTLRDEFIWEAITTNMDIDARWDTYVNKWMGSGGKEVLAELEKMPIVEELRMGNVVY